MYSEFLSKQSFRTEPSVIREITHLISSTEIISFAGGMPDPDNFPVPEIEAAFSSAARKYPQYMFQYGTTEGVTGLREKISNWLNKEESLSISADDVLVTHGSQQGIDLVSRTLINSGDVVIVSSPTYFGGTNAFKAYGAEVIGIPEDKEGVDIEKLVEKLENLSRQNKTVKFLYLVPNFANPTGKTISLQRRNEILSLAEKYDFLIFEDDPYGTLRFEGEKLPSLKSLDNKGRVIYAYSFSKILSPGLRLSAITANKDLLRAIIVSKQYADACTNSIGQYILYNILLEDKLSSIISRSIEWYRKKRDLMLGTLQKVMPESVSWNHPQGGFFIFVELPENFDTLKLLESAVKAQVAFVPGKPFYSDGGGKNFLRLSYSQPSEKDIINGLEILGKLISSQMVQVA